MRWGNSTRDLIGSTVVGAALIAGLVLPAQADDNKVSLSAIASFTTDYVFRGVSYSKENPAVQPELDLAYGIFYAGIWGSNVDFGGTGTGRNISTVEIDYYAGLAPV